MGAELARDEDALVLDDRVIVLREQALLPQARAHICSLPAFELRHVRRSPFGLRLTGHTQALSGLRIK